jgi:hypothetical protein
MFQGAAIIQKVAGFRNHLGERQNFSLSPMPPSVQSLCAQR